MALAEEAYRNLRQVDAGKTLLSTLSTVIFSAYRTQIENLIRQGTDPETLVELQRVRSKALAIGKEYASTAHFKCIIFLRDKQFRENRAARIRISEEDPGLPTGPRQDFVEWQGLLDAHGHGASRLLCGFDCLSTPAFDLRGPRQDLTALADQRLQNGNADLGTLLDQPVAASSLGWGHCQGQP